MSFSELGAMYGREGTYFARLPEGFENYVWMELIGFDNTAPDFGVEELLERMGFRPEGFLLLLTSIDFVNMHHGCEIEAELDPCYCSYDGHSCGDDRSIQRWTNLQLQKLVAVLHGYGITVYPSFFDFACPRESILNAHPELCAHICTDGVVTHTRSIYMTKRFQDGTFYEDFFLKKAIEVLSDYGFDGIHLADGVVRPRLPLQTAEYSADSLEQAGISLPDDTDPAAYILEHHRSAWLDACTTRWSAYLKKVVTGIHTAGFRVITNSTWTKDPMEARYRYGIDYRVLDELPLHAFVVENGAPTIAMLDDDASAGYRQSYADRQMVHHAFRSSLMCIRAQMGATRLCPLFPVRDTREQYDVIHHMPTTLPRHTAAMFASFIWKPDGTLAPVFHGHTFCLGDGLSRDNWRFLRLCSDNGYMPQVQDVPGATLIWSDIRNEAEVRALMAHRTPGTSAWHAALLRRGAAVYKVAHIRNLNAVRGDIVVPNPELLPPDERAKIDAYASGRIFRLSLPHSGTDYSLLPNPIGVGFPYPLFFEPFDEAVLSDAVQSINENLAQVVTYCDECHVQEIRLNEHVSRFLVDNEEFYYAVPRIRTGRPIAHATAITHSSGYPVSIQDDTFRVLVPLRGIAIVEVTFCT